jgi:cell division inhibitor SepF
MALSEGFRGFVDMLKGTFSPEEDIDDPQGAFDFGGDYPVEDNLARKPQNGIDELYPTTTVPATISRRQRNRETNVTPMTGYKSSEVTVIEPRSFSESAQIVKKLIEKKTVILHLDLLDKEQSQRTIDFVCGASHALDGSVQKISESVVIFTPSSVALSVESSATQSKFTESLWKPL